VNRHDSALFWASPHRNHNLWITFAVLRSIKSKAYGFLTYFKKAFDFEKRPAYNLVHTATTTTTTETKLEVMSSGGRQEKRKNFKDFDFFS
jgi:hypothetical protein